MKKPASESERRKQHLSEAGGRIYAYVVLTLLIILCA